MNLLEENTPGLQEDADRRTAARNHAGAQHRGGVTPFVFPLGSRNRRTRELLKELPTT